MVPVIEFKPDPASSQVHVRNPPDDVEKISYRVHDSGGEFVCLDAFRLIQTVPTSLGLVQYPNEHGALRRRYGRRRLARGLRGSDDVPVAVQYRDLDACFRIKRELERTPLGEFEPEEIHVIFGCNGSRDILPGRDGGRACDRIGMVAAGGRRDRDLRRGWCNGRRRCRGLLAPAATASRQPGQRDADNRKLRETLESTRKSRVFPFTQHRSLSLLGRAGWLRGVFFGSDRAGYGDGQGPVGVERGVVEQPERRLPGRGALADGDD